MRCVLEGTLLACSKSRVWSLAQERKANQVLARGIRRCLGLDRYNMRQFSYSDESLRELVQWDHFSTLVHRNVLRWLGHVARMSCARLPKMALFGWPKGHEEHRSGKCTFPMWAQWLLTKHGFSQMDWFRLAQKPTRNWVRMVNQVLPRSRLSVRQVLQVNQWQPGDAVPDAGQTPPAIAPLSSNPLQCPACPFVADTSKGLQVHYDSFHAIQDDSLTTVGVGACPHCHQQFVFRKDRLRHRCPKKPHTLHDVETMLNYPTVVQSAPVNLSVLCRWAMFTDGAGPVEGRAPHAG